MLTVHSKFFKNGRATGPDGIPGELLKYGPPTLHKNIADILNQMMAKGEDLDLGNGTLIVLQKPGKPKGPPSAYSSTKHATQNTISHRIGTH